MTVNGHSRRTMDGHALHFAVFFFVLLASCYYVVEALITYGWGLMNVSCACVVLIWRRENWYIDIHVFAL
jgi:hypothetical protein